MANYSDVHYSILADYLGETITDVVLVIDFNNRTHYDDSDAETDIMDYPDHQDYQDNQDDQLEAGQTDQGDADWEYLMNNINELGGLLNPDHDYSGSDFESDPSDLADDDVSSISDVTEPEAIVGDAPNDEADIKTSPQEVSPEPGQEEDESDEPDLSGDSDEIIWTDVDSEMDTLPEDSATYQLLETIARARR